MLFYIPPTTGHRLIYEFSTHNEQNTAPNEIPILSNNLFNDTNNPIWCHTTGIGLWMVEDGLHLTKDTMILMLEWMVKYILYYHHYKKSNQTTCLLYLTLILTILFYFIEYCINVGLFMKWNSPQLTNIHNVDSLGGFWEKPTIITTNHILWTCHLYKMLATMIDLMSRLDIIIDFSWSLEGNGAIFTDLCPHKN